MHTGKMNTSNGTREIVKTVEEQDSEIKIDENAGKHHFLKASHKYAVEDDINRLFEAINIRTSKRRLASPPQNVTDALQKRAMKRPIRPGFTQASGIGISESMSLKQALRGLCISQASEMAAMKRLSKASRFSGVSELGAIKRLYGRVTVEASGSGHPLSEGKRNLVEISLVPEKSNLIFAENNPHSPHMLDEKKSNQDSCSSVFLINKSIEETKIDKAVAPDEILPLPIDVENENTSELGQKGKMSPFPAHSSEKLPMRDEILPASVQSLSVSAAHEKGLNVMLHSTASLSYSRTGSKVTKSAGNSHHLIKPILRNKKLKSSGLCASDLSPNTSKVHCHSPSSAPNTSIENEKACPSSSGANVSIEASSSVMDSCTGKPGLTLNFSGRTRTVVSKIDERAISREKGVFSQSSKSSHGEVSSSTSFSEDSSLSGSSRSGHRPHMSKDLRWEAIRCVQKQHGRLGLRHFKLLRKLGGGDIGTVYLAELRGMNCLFALKIMDNQFLALRKKVMRAHTEREILQMLDHPFLPTLFSHFTTDRFSCLVLEYCPGGDLHVLRQRQPVKSFSEEAARFYTAEVLLALEYLHMLGVVYRDLKPENILVREDGHIMLSDFDLSLKCAVKPMLIKSSSPVIEPPKKVSNPCIESSCMEPFFIQPSCFSPRLLFAAARARKIKSDLGSQVISQSLPQLVVEPTDARSNSFVGTHEYLSPEIIKGQSHGSAVDWWTFGIFLYELLYGKTPFKGPAKEDTLSNVVSKCVKFPESSSSPMVSSNARNLIRRLLQKEPENRLGSVKGAAEIKEHPFFEGLNWALIRCAVPPELPQFCDYGTILLEESPRSKENDKSLIVCNSNNNSNNSTGEDLEFDMF